VGVTTRSLRDGDDGFDVTLVEADDPTHLILFAVGGGGNPERHLPLLTTLAGHGCTVVAPHFERLVAPEPTDHDLLLRARRLSRAIDFIARPGLPVAGVGHSIGCTMLLALAGGQVWMRAGHRLAIAPDPRLERLALFTPATGFFQAPGALDTVRTPILAWAASADTVTPPAQATVLRQAIDPGVTVEVRLVEGAGHFSFMNQPPPHVVEPLADREAFLADLAEDVCRFVTT
jgi:dienelactone hydrolase